MLSQAASSLGGLASGGLGPLLPAVAAVGARLLGRSGLLQQQRGLQWSVEKEPQSYKAVDDIIQDHVIVAALEKTQQAAKDPARVRDILTAAKERSFLTNHKPGGWAWAWGRAGLRGVAHAQLLSPPFGPREAPCPGWRERLAPPLLTAAQPSPRAPPGAATCGTHCRTLGAGTLRAGPSEYVQGLTYEECATLLNVDVGNEQIMSDIFDTGRWVGPGRGSGSDAGACSHGWPCLMPASDPAAASRCLRAQSAAAFAIKQRIYGNRIVLFAPLYIANYCVNNCRYCAFRQGNKSLEVRRAWQ